jgi:N-methylhydantoinase B
VVRIRTTGGGGWGDPLDRPVEEVLRDVAWRKVSPAGARVDYGVVVGDDGTCDEAATDRLRREMRDARTGDEPFFDRGPGYARLSGGAAFNEFDLL